MSVVINQQELSSILGIMFIDNILTFFKMTFVPLVSLVANDNSEQVCTCVLCLLTGAWYLLYLQEHCLYITYYCFVYKSFIIG